MKKHDKLRELPPLAQESKAIAMEVKMLNRTVLCDFVNNFKRKANIALSKSGMAFLSKIEKTMAYPTDFCFELSEVFLYKGTPLDIRIRLGEYDDYGKIPEKDDIYPFDDEEWEWNEENDNSEALHRRSIKISLPTVEIPKLKSSRYYGLNWDNTNKEYTVHSNFSLDDVYQKLVTLHNEYSKDKNLAKVEVKRKKDWELRKAKSDAAAKVEAK